MNRCIPWGVVVAMLLGHAGLVVGQDQIKEMGGLKSRVGDGGGKKETGRSVDRNRDNDRPKPRDNDKPHMSKDKDKDKHHDKDKDDKGKAPGNFVPQPQFFGKPKKPKLSDFYKQLDTNGDGKLSLDEFLADKNEDAKLLAEGIFKAKDTNHDDKMTLAEFMAPPKKDKGKKPEEEKVAEEKVAEEKLPEEKAPAAKEKGDEKKAAEEKPVEK